MKKTLVAVAALSAMAASAMAADVTLYGKLDQAVMFTKTTPAVGAKTSTFEFKSGVSSGSRWGIKGVEDVGAFKVGFVLESGFAGDDGKSGQGSRLFGRDSFLTLDGAYGLVRFGRTGSLAEGCTGDMVAGQMTPFGTTYGYAAGTSFLAKTTGGRMDNTIYYATPKMAGFQVVAEYSNGIDGADGTAGAANRYAAMGVSYANGGLYVAATAETLNRVDTATVDDPTVFTLAANYNFGPAKVFAGYQHAKHSTTYTVLEDVSDAKMDAFSIGLSANLLGGTAMANYGYTKAESAVDGDLKRMVFSVGYKYSFSKRTYAYGAYNYAQDKNDDDKSKGHQVFVGMCHNF